MIDFQRQATTIENILKSEGLEANPCVFCYPIQVNDQHLDLIKLYDETVSLGIETGITVYIDLDNKQLYRGSWGKTSLSTWKEELKDLWHGIKTHVNDRSQKRFLFYQKNLILLIALRKHLGIIDQQRYTEGKQKVLKIAWQSLES